MILATHAIISAYGFWLPNDPCGSWSTFVASWELFKYGLATKVSTHRSVAYKPHNRDLRLAAKSALKFPPVIFTAIQARAIARGFAQAVQDGGYTIHACSILTDHAHLVIARNTKDADDIVAHLQSAATKRLRVENLDPFGPFHLASSARPRHGRAMAGPSFSIRQPTFDGQSDMSRTIRSKKPSGGRNGIS